MTEVATQIIAQGGIRVPTGAALGKVATSDANGNMSWGTVGGGDRFAGEIVATARSTAPSGWLLCDGTAVSRSTYPDLFTAIGTSYGAGDGSTTFNLPDLRGRVPVGVDGTAGRMAANDGLAQSGGAETHTLSVAEMPSHRHRIAATYATIADGRQIPLGQNGTAYQDSNGGVAHLENTGGGGAHNNMPPYVIVNYVIKATNSTAPANISRVTSLPASPVDGQEVFYIADATNGILWHLRYNSGSASAYKWEVLGGNPLSHEIDTSQGTASTTFVDLATAGPSVTVPLAGDYILDFGTRISGSTGDYGVMSPNIAGATPLGADEVAKSGASDVHVHRSRRKNALAASSVIKMQYRSTNGAATQTFYNRSLFVRPVRVG